MPAKDNEKIGQDEARSPEPANLDRRYGKIGIPAVAAALPYFTAPRPARAPSATRIEDRFIELAA